MPRFDVGWQRDEEADGPMIAKRWSGTAVGQLA